MADLLVPLQFSTIQAGLNAAGAGDRVVLNANRLYTESVQCPNKGVLSAYITVTTDAPAGSLPLAGNRTSTSLSAFMPKIQSPGGGASTLTFAPGANHYKFQHIEFPQVPYGFGDIITIGAGDNSQSLESQEPTDIIIDQCYVHGDPISGQKRGIALNGKRLTITNNVITGMAGLGQDSQAIAGWNGHGPVTIENNEIEGAGENLILGGGDPGIHTYLTVTGSNTTTGAAVSCAESGHTLAELANGQLVAVETTAGVLFANLTAQPGSGTTGTLAWSPAISTAPSIGMRIRAGCVVADVTIRKNWIHKNLAWFTGAILGTPTGLSASVSTVSGTLPSGTTYYKVQACTNAGYNQQFTTSDASAEVSATLGASGTKTISCTAVTSAAFYRWWKGTSAGAEDRYVDTVSPTLVDDGTKTYTLGTIPTGSRWQVKNLFELKAAQRVQMDSNILEYSWRGHDLGWMMWLKSVNQDGNAWFIQTRDVVIEKNIFRHGVGWFVINGREGNPLPPSATNITVRNNLVYDSSGPTWGQGFDQWAMEMVGAPSTITVDHNTLFHQSSVNYGGLLVLDGPGVTQTVTALVMQNNMLLGVDPYGIHTAAGTGTAALNDGAAGWVFTHNEVADASAGSYPANNTYEVAASFQQEFVSYVFDGSGTADFHVKATSRDHLAGTDGKDIGCDVDLVLAATATVLSGTAVASRIDSRERRASAIGVSLTAPRLLHFADGLNTVRSRAFLADLYSGSTLTVPLIVPQPRLATATTWSTESPQANVTWTQPTTAFVTWEP